MVQPHGSIFMKGLSLSDLTQKKANSCYSKEQYLFVNDMKTLVENPEHLHFDSLPGLPKTKSLSASETSRTITSAAVYGPGHRAASTSAWTCPSALSLSESSLKGADVQVTP